MGKKDVFLYLLGAGASCEALPLAGALPGRLAEFAKELRRAGPRISELDESELPTSDSLWGKAREDLAIAIEWLAKESSIHKSVDAFARKLYLRNDRDDLRKLKAALSAYLVAEQAQKDVDWRYNYFLAHVLVKHDDKRQLRLPLKLQILTWNYDTQLEKAFYGFCEDQDTVERRITNNDRQIHRINGCCGRDHAGNIDEWFCSVWDTTSDAGWKAAIALYKKYMAKFRDSEIPDICFAWEELRTNYNLGDVSVLVVIGYSFPDFNREIDKLIFGRLGIELRQVYLQCLEKDRDLVKKRLESLLPPIALGESSVVSITKPGAFYIPDEFWL